MGRRAEIGNDPLSDRGGVLAVDRPEDRLAGRADAHRLVQRRCLLAADLADDDRTTAEPEGSSHRLAR